jgi:hypothetical protein
MAEAPYPTTKDKRPSTTKYTKYTKKDKDKDKKEKGKEPIHESGRIGDECPFLAPHFMILPHNLPLVFFVFVFFRVFRVFRG